MMGHRQVEQAALFYEFSLERHIPADHLLRSIDRFVDLEQVRRDLAPFYSSIGRPSIDPELMIRMLLIGYCFGIRSERRLNSLTTRIQAIPIRDDSGRILRWCILLTNIEDRRHGNRSGRIRFRKRERDESAVREVGLDEVQRHAAPAEACPQKGVFGPEIGKPPGLGRYHAQVLTLGQARSIGQNELDMLRPKRWLPSRLAERDLAVIDPDKASPLSEVASAVVRSAGGD